MSQNHSPPLARACNRCRRRKIRCDRGSPCSTCQSTGAECKTSERASTQKRTRVLISSQYEEKIDLIDKRLSCLIETLNTEITTRSMDKSCSLPPSYNRPSSHSALASPAAEKGPGQNSPLSNDRTKALPESVVDDEMVVVEGKSSLTAHSTFAIEFVHNAVDSCGGMEGSNEISELLKTLRCIEDAMSHQHLSSKPLFPLAQAGYEMPPLKVAVQVLQKTQDKRSFSFFCIHKLIGPRSISDLCLKVYFSSEYSDAEFIIVNAVLNFLVSDIDNGQNDNEVNDEHSMLVLMCRKNLETALSRLPLYIKANYDMILALVLGAIYAIDISNPSLAWTLVAAASQCSHSLGFDTRSSSPSELPYKPDKKQLLFWGVYFLEKSLCLRLGRSSTLPDCDATAVWPEGRQMTSSPVIAYTYQIVKLAGLAGRIYEQLYSADALQNPGNTRLCRALELSQELHGYCVEARNINQLWMQSSTDVRDQKQIRFIFASDEILRLSMLTLVYRAMPPQRDPGTTFGKECITSARCALESHQVFVRDLGAKGSPLLLSIYMNWTIMFTPFIPFIVLFCHSIETGDGGDLDRMRTFINSIECTCQHSNVIARHYRLFQVFHGVAVRYNELKSSSSSREEQAQLRTEVDAHLTALGLHPHMTYATGDYAQETIPSVGVAEQNQDSGENDWTQQGLSLGNWFSFNQQMMGLLDHNNLPF